MTAVQTTAIILYATVFLFSAVMTTVSSSRTSANISRPLRILSIQSVAAKSHWNFMKGVLLALADRGHKVTVYTPIVECMATTGDNYVRVVDTSSKYNKNVTAIGMDTVRIVSFTRLSGMLSYIVNADRFACDLIDRLLAEVVNGEDNENAFDLFITEQIGTECTSYTASRLGIPLIYTQPSSLQPWIETAAFGHYANPAYVPHLMSTYVNLDSFYQRLHNTGLYLYTVFLNYWYTTMEFSLYDRVPPVKPSLVFVNTHYITEFTQPPVPVNRVDVGGIHLIPPKPLPNVSVINIKLTTHDT